MSMVGLGWLLASMLLAPPAPEAVLQAAFADGAWRPSGAPRIITGTDIYEYMDGAGELPLACGYRRLVVQALRHGDGRQLTVELYACANSADAYGIYSLRRQPGEEIVALSHRARYVEGELAGWRGVYTFVLSTAARTQVSRDELAALARRVEAQIGDAGALPDLLRYLPAEGRVPDSGRYFHGKFALDTVWFQRDNVLSVGERTETVAARYEQPAAGALVTAYATADEAQVALAQWAKSRSAGEAAVAVGSRLGLVFDAADAGAAETLSARLRRSLADPGPVWTEG